MSADAVPKTPREEAADWFALRRSGAMSAEDARAFDVWLARAPEHARAFATVERAWATADAARSDPELLAIREEALQAHAPARRLALAAVAASALIAAGGAAWTWRGAVETLFAPPPEQEFRTGTGQITKVHLSDGSIVTLDTDTIVEARTNGRKRLVTLVRGRAFFQVAKDRARPFVVAANGKTVTATGTAFDVRLDPHRMEVTLIDGSVTVAEPKGQFWRARSTDMMAGWRLTAGEDGRWRVTPVDLVKDTSWLNGRLIFDNEPMGEVAAELNRYSRKKIVIADAAVAAKPIIGVFAAGDVDEFAKMVTSYRLARVARQDENEIELAAP